MKPFNKHEAARDLCNLEAFEFCYVKTVARDPITGTTATGSFVVTKNGDSCEIIFARSVDMLNKQIISTEYFLDDRYADLNRAFEEHYNLDFIFKDCITLSFELVRDAEYYRDPLGSHEKYGQQVFHQDLEELTLTDGTVISRGEGWGYGFGNVE